MHGAGKRVIKPAYPPMLTQARPPVHPTGHCKCIAPINYSQQLHYQGSERGGRRILTELAPLRALCLVRACHWALCST